MKKILISLLSIFIFPLSVYASSNHIILGTDTRMSSGNWEIISDLKVSNLQIRHVRRHVGVDFGCSKESQYDDHLEINGPINPDTPYIVEKLLKKIEDSPHRCLNENGERLAVPVYLNSGGGYLEDGFKLGKIFREYGAQTGIADYGGECYSSCATAFLGGKFRTMGEESIIMFHAPYTYSSIYGQDISCSKSDQELLYYMETMLNKVDGKFLYERTMSYCSTSTGWTLNNDAAEIFEIINWF